MTDFKWLNLELYQDPDADFRWRWRRIEGELIEVRPNTSFGVVNSLLGEQYILPKYYAETDQFGQYKKVLEGRNVVRLLIPVIKGS